MSENVTIRVSKRVLRRVGRVLLALAAVAFTVNAAIGTLPIYEQKPFGTWTVSPDSLSTEAKINLARRLDSLADRLPKQPLMTSQDEWYQWALEILPYMSYEGVINGAARIPQDVTPFFVPTARIFHVAGFAVCRDADDKPATGPVSLNVRYLNQVSPRYGDEIALSVLVHELVHMQSGPFCSGLSEDLEANTQIAAMEVMAAMVNHGNRQVLRPLLLELRAMLLAALQYDLGQTAYLDFLRTLANDPFEVARAEKSLRFWNSQPGGAAELRGILLRYNVVPVNALIEAAQDGTVERIQLVDSANYLCPPCGAVSMRPFAADDLYSFWRHMDAFVAAAELETKD